MLTKDSTPSINLRKAEKSPKSVVADKPQRSSFVLKALASGTYGGGFMYPEPPKPLN